MFQPKEGQSALVDIDYFSCFLIQQENCIMGGIKNGAVIRFG